GGESWSTFNSPENETIEEIIADPYNPERIWIVKSGFTEGAKVYQSETGGQSWINISGTLPNISALSIIYQEGTNDGIYLGMTYGVYYRNGTMDDWIYFGQGLPNTEIRDLDIQYNSGKIRCATYGRGLFEADLYPIDEIQPDASFSAALKTVCLGDTVFFINESTGADTFLWNFGDGTLSNNYSPDHIYPEPGRYTVSLTATGDQLSGNMTRHSYIEINPYLPPVNIGEKDRDKGSVLYLNDDSFGMIFNVHFPSILLSVKVYTFVKGNRRFEVYDKNGTLVSKATVNLHSGENRVPLGFYLSPGTDYVLRVSGFAYLFYNSDGARYPYAKNDLLSITGNTAFSREKYYYFYDWEVQYMTCSDESLPVTGEAENVAADRIIIAPNPVWDQFTVTLMGFGLDEMVNIRIFTLEGILVYKAAINQERKITLPRSILPEAAGIYILEAGSPGNRYTKSIVTVN
ncbi:MAG: PKD domain-containing protein, partial [Bacteroidia bacterium]